MRTIGKASKDDLTMHPLPENHFAVEKKMPAFDFWSVP